MALFRISVYDGDREFRCQIGNPTALRATIRHNMVSTLWMTVPLDHPRIDDLLADDARLRVQFKGEHLISGPVTEWEGETDGVSGYLTVAIEDDFRVLREILGWPVPWSAISAQSGTEYRTYTGTAETIVKMAVSDNGVTRLAVPGLTVAPSLGRGASIPGGVPLRMHPLADQLFPAVTNAGLGVTVQQDGTSLVLDVREPVTHPRTLSVAGRTLKSARWTRTRPVASRAIIGGSGEGTARVFRALTDTARETQYAMRAETFVDARDAGSDYLALGKDVTSAAADLKEANQEVKEADRALDAANVAYANADQAYDIAEATGNSSLISSAASKRTTAQGKVTSRLADYNAAVADENTKQTAHNTLTASIPAALTAYRAVMDERGQEAVTENGPKNGVDLTLAGSGIFQYGPGGFRVGDRIPINLGNGVIVTEVLRECTLEWVSPTHASVEPEVGEIVNQPDRVLRQQVAALTRSKRNQGTN